MSIETQNLPAMFTYDGGWGDPETDDRLIQGTLIRCVDGRWTDKDGAAPPAQLLALGSVTAIQRWKDKRPVETIVKRPGVPFPNVEDLNDQVPQSEWEPGVDGQPRPPWQLQYFVYLLNGATAEKFTYANGTTGAGIAVRNLKDQVS